MENRLMVHEGQLLAVFNSAHRVMKAESILKGEKMPVLLIPAPRQLSTDCGLALRFGGEAFETVMQTLRQNNLLPEFVCRHEKKQYLTIWPAQDAATAETLQG